MNLKRCVNGHYYDADEHAFCPKCEEKGLLGDGPVSEASEAAPERKAAVYEAEPVRQTAFGEEKSGRTAAAAAAGTAPQESPAAVKAVSRTAPEEKLPDKKKEPVAGWLACIEGELYGQIFELKYGENRIGGTADMDVALTGDPKAARCCQVVVTYDSESKLFTANAGEARELSYVNGQVILFDSELHDRDVIQTGGVRLMFISLCGPDFSWEEQNK